MSSSAASVSGASSNSTNRGVLILPGLGNCTEDYDQLKVDLQKRGLTVQVAKVARPDWSRNAAALTDDRWWKGTLKPRPAVDWWVGKLCFSCIEYLAGAQLAAHAAGSYDRTYALCMYAMLCGRQPIQREYAVIAYSPVGGMHETLS